MPWTLCYCGKPVLPDEMYCSASCAKADGDWRDFQEQEKDFEEID